MIIEVNEVSVKQFQWNCIAKVDNDKRRKVTGLEIQLKSFLKFLIEGRNLMKLIDNE